MLFSDRGHAAAFEKQTDQKRAIDALYQRPVRFGYRQLLEEDFTLPVPVLLTLACSYFGAWPSFRSRAGRTMTRGSRALKKRRQFLLKAATRLAQHEKSLSKLHENCTLPCVEGPLRWLHLAGSPGFPPGWPSCTPRPLIPSCLGSACQPRSTLCLFLGHPLACPSRPFDTREIGSASSCWRIYTLFTCLWLKVCLRSLTSP